MNEEPPALLSGGPRSGFSAPRIQPRWVTSSAAFEGARSEVMTPGQALFGYP